MYGFLLLLGMLAANVLACGAMFFAGQTVLIVPLALMFFVVYGLTAFRAGRGVEFRSPIAPRGTRVPAAARPKQQRPRPAPETANEFGLLE
jgi:hypothetical protein